MNDDATDDPQWLSAPGRRHANPGDKNDARQIASAAERNLAPIMDVLGPLLPHDGLVLEIASGTGQHAFAFAESFSGIEWQPSDPNPQARASIGSWQAYAGCENFLPPIDIDVSRPNWWTEFRLDPDAIIAINLLQVSRWSAAEGLFAGAGALLKKGGFVYIYGPYKRDGKHISDSNAAFDEDLRARNPEWGVRDISEVEELARRHRLELESVVAMPANNFSLIFRKAA